MASQSNKELEPPPSYPPSYPQSSATHPVPSSPDPADNIISIVNNKATTSTDADAPRIYACVTLESSDTIVFIQFPPELPDAVRELLKNNWSSGIQREHASKSANAYAFKLRGYPWSTTSHTSLLQGLGIICAVLEHLYHDGWELIRVTDVGQGQETIMFRSGQISPAPSSFLVMSFAFGNNSLRLMKASFDTLHEVRKALGRQIKSEGYLKQNSDAYEFILFGSPWSQEFGNEPHVTLRILLLSIVEAMSVVGWELHASISFRFASKPADTWFFRKVKPGSQV